eukprot:TRINITY_DN1696_c1_g1_i2.p1 TRINITY_DN1696_c1_g1~~TRINITY_DN1696_c1_g1_i2.p1  ORF type:complete len:232 (+),score=65.63 TRINITY_DN1696_c1_g1_i2:52-696(+)
MPDTLYAHPISQGSRSCLWFLDFKGDTTTVRRIVKMEEGEHKSPEHVAKFPAGQVPGFEMEDGFCFAESAAILKHLSKGVEEVAPKDAKEEARVNEYIGKHLSEVRNITLKMVLPFVIMKDEELGRKGYKEVTPVLQRYDSVLSRQSHIACNHLTIADFLFATEVDQLDLFDPAYLEPFPHIKKYLESLQDVPGYKACIDGCKAAIAGAEGGGN